MKGYFLLSLLGVLGIIFGLYVCKIEWKKYKSGIAYGVTNHIKALIIVIIFFIVFAGGITKLLST